VSDVATDTRNQTVLESDDQAAGAIARLREQYLNEFDATYVDHVILPYVTNSSYQGERPSLPMIDVRLSKENAMPAQLWGLLNEDWATSLREGGTVFLQGLENRGPGNLRKKIYMSATTPDLYASMYRDKVRRFFAGLLDDANAGKPLMQRYVDGYFDLYWDLHLGVRGDAIPDRVRQIGHSFINVLAYRDPTLKIYYDNYLTVRAHRAFLQQWIAERIADLLENRISHPEQTFVHYWVKNAGNGEHFKHEDIVFECFHNFLAFSQWGNTLYNVMSRLTSDGDPDVRAWFRRTMLGELDGACEFSPLERLVMELFRTISPNNGSLSALEEVGSPSVERRGLMITPHAATSRDPRHWRDPAAFNPDRYLSAPTSHQIDEPRCTEIGFAQRPFDPVPMDVADGRPAMLRSSGFGTVYPVIDGEPHSVCDYAGYAPFGFGYRRCAGEQLTISVFVEFLTMVWERGIEFEVLDIAEPARLPVGPSTVIADDIGFTRKPT
jgi:cytochrome P450